MTTSEKEKIQYMIDFGKFAREDLNDLNDFPYGESGTYFLLNAVLIYDHESELTEIIEELELEGQAISPSAVAAKIRIKTGFEKPKLHN